MTPTDTQFWEAIRLRDQFIDELRYTLTLALDEIGFLTKMIGSLSPEVTEGIPMTDPRQYDRWKDILRQGAKPTKLADVR